MEKKLYRVEEGKMLCGVCKGIAEYFGIDVTLIRLLMVVLALAGSLGIIFYIAAAIIVPVKPPYIEGT